MDFNLCLEFDFQDYFHQETFGFGLGSVEKAVTELFKKKRDLESDRCESHS